MSDDTADRRHYYVFGVGASETELSYVGLSERPPDHEAPDICRKLARSPNVPLREWAERALEGGEADAFELDSYDTRREAEEAVGFWRRYFRSLGLSTIETEGVG